jgi:hypothetical protein
MVCSRCGSELVPGSLICGSCGAVVSNPQGPGPGTPAGQKAAGASPAPSYIVRPPRVTPKAESEGGSKRTTLIIIGAAAACVFVILLLGFAVGPKWFTGGNKQLSGPEQAMNSFYQALIEGDAPALVSLMNPASLQQFKTALSSGGFKSMEQYMQAFLKQINPQGDLQISDLSYRTTISGEQATVEVTGGKATYTDAQGNQVTETPESGGTLFSQKQFSLRNVDGTWYIEPGM